jgi:hypothetical protein
VRTLLLTILLTAPSIAEEKPQIDWVGDWETAFQQAKKTGKPVMVCINSKDGERANETTASKIYRDPLFVAMTRKFVMVLISTREHAGDGACPRFGCVTCEQHLDCWKDLRAAHGETFVIPGSGGDMISPQHAWFTPDGTLLSRKEYFLAKAELSKRMRSVLTEMKKSAGAGDETELSGKDDPLDGKDKAALERLKRADSQESRSAALGILLATQKTAVYAELGNLLQATKSKELKCYLLRGLAREELATVRVPAERLLSSKDAEIRSFAAVALEELGRKESISALLKRLRVEQDKVARKNLCRALGVCGGPVADKSAAKALLKVVSSDKQKVVCKHAALALRSYEGEGAKLVVKRLEKAASSTKDADLRRAIVYALAYVGNAKSTVSVLNKLVEKSREKWEKTFLGSAIRKLQAEPEEEDKFAESAKWLFWEDRQDPARAS